MGATIIDGKAIAESIRESIRERVADLKKRKQITPGLAVIVVGNDPASAVYVRNKENACIKAGMHSLIMRLPEDTKQEELLHVLAQLNNDAHMHGILVQLPLPKHLDEQAVIEAIAPHKDVDGFHPINSGALLNGMKGFVPCTPRGCMHLIKSTGENIEGKEAVVIGRSNIVGKPVSLLLLQANATVTICHSKTKNLADVVRRADIVVAAIGRAGMIHGDMMKPGAIVIDVGINRGEDGTLYGDVDFESAKDVAGYITPVPGGVGPLTIAMLLENTLEAAELYG